jgi:hypothetical protein
MQVLKKLRKFILLDVQQIWKHNTLLLCIRSNGHWGIAAAFLIKIFMVKTYLLVARNISQPLDSLSVMDDLRLDVDLKIRGQEG